MYVYETQTLSYYMNEGVVWIRRFHVLSHVMWLVWSLLV